MIEFSCFAERVEDKYIRFKGTANLPAQTHLMLTLSSTEHAYRAQSKVDVQQDGSFISEVFAYAKNKDDKAILNGCYKLEITVPIVSVQPDSVQAVMGKKGRNLSGKYVEEDSVLGKTVSYSYEFQVQ